MARSKEKRADIWMPLFIADYLADTSHLSAAEHGAYLLMLMHAWMNNGCLPKEDERLRRIARMDAKEWRDASPELRSYFYEADDGLRHHRLDKELVRANANVDQRSRAGKASAEARKQKREAQQGAKRIDNEGGNGISTDVERALQRDGERDPQRNGRPPPPPSPTKTLSSGIATDGGCACASESPLAAAFVDALQASGIPATANDARLQRWGEEGATPAELAQAIARAQQRRRKEGSAQPVNVGLVDVLLADILAARSGPTTAGSVPDQDWWESASGITKQGDQMGLHQHADEPFPYFKARVFEAAGDGPWAWKARGAVTITGETPAADVLRRH